MVSNFLFGKNESPKQSDNMSVEEALTALRQFIQVKRGADESDRRNVFKQFNADLLGNENWIVGLLGMMYDRNIKDPVLIGQLVKQLLLSLRDLESKSNRDQSTLFYIISILKALMDRSPSFDGPTRIQIQDIIRDLHLISHTDKDIREKTFQLMKCLRQEGASQFKELFETENTTQTAPATVSDEDKTKYFDLSEPPSTEPIYALDDYLNVQASMALGDLLADPTFSIRPLLLMASPSNFIDQLCANIKSIDLKRLAIVTHPMVQINPVLKHKIHLKLIHVDPIHRIRAIYSAIEELFRDGFGRIVAIMPKAEYWSDFHYARHAAYRLEEYVSIVDSGLYGLGLSLIIEECIQSLIQLPNPQDHDIGLLINQLQPHVRHWILIENEKQLNEQYWYHLLRQQHRGPDTHHMPILRMFNNFGIVAIDNTPENGINALVTELTQQQQTEKQKPNRIVIEHHGMVTFIPTLATMLQKAYPNIPIETRTATKTLYQDLGHHISVGIISRRH